MKDFRQHMNTLIFEVKFISDDENLERVTVYHGQDSTVSQYPVEESFYLSVPRNGGMPPEPYKRQLVIAYRKQLTEHLRQWIQEQSIDIYIGFAGFGIAMRK